MVNQTQKKIFIIVNKFSGHRRKFTEAVFQIISELQANGCEVELAYTMHRGHATELAKKASGVFDLVVAVGGDGTVNEVGQGLIGTSTPMGIIPMGSGNGLARELGISMNILKGSRLLMHGNEQTMDVCSIKNQQFLCTSGIGFDAIVADKMANAKTRGFWRYLKIVIAESIKFKPFNVKMEMDGQLLETPVFLVTFANARQFGNNAYIARHASISDGLLDVVVVKPFHKIWLPVFGIGLFARYIHKLPFVETYRTKSVIIYEAETNIYHFDGEPGKISFPTEISVERHKLSVIQ